MSRHYRRERRPAAEARGSATIRRCAIPPRATHRRPAPDRQENGVALIDKQAFVGLDGIAHLATGGEAPWLRSHDDACRRFGQLKSAGMAGRDEMFAVYRRAKARVARRLGVAP